MSFRPMCPECNDDMSLLCEETKEGIQFRFECEECDSSFTVVMQTAIKPSEVKKLARLKTIQTKEMKIGPPGLFE